MAAHSGEKRSLKRRAGGWLYNIVFTPGWVRWILLAVLAVVFMLAAYGLTRGVDYRKDPSALVPRSVLSYAETTGLDTVLRYVGSWKIWREDRRATDTDQYNQIQIDIAGLIGEQVPGLGSRPLRWIARTGRAAYCDLVDESGKESWALLLQVENPLELLSELSAEKTLRLEQIAEGTKESGITRLTSGDGAGELYFTVLNPWFIISSSDTLPKFARESVRRPSYSLAGAKLVPEWRYKALIRGLYTPDRFAQTTGGSAYVTVAGWMGKDVRIGFMTSFRNGVETTFTAGELTDKSGGGGAWPLLWLLLLIVAVIAFLGAVGIILVMVGWGGWFKALAIKSGVKPAKGPEPVQPSEAFTEDAGLNASATDGKKGPGVASSSAGDEFDGTKSSAGASASVSDSHEEAPRRDGPPPASGSHEESNDLAEREHLRDTDSLA